VPAEVWILNEAFVPVATGDDTDSRVSADEDELAPVGALEDGGAVGAATLPVSVSESQSPPGVPAAWAAGRTDSQLVAMILLSDNIIGYWIQSR